MNKTVLLNRLTLFLMIMNSGGIPFIKNLYITIFTLIIIGINTLRQNKYNSFTPIMGMLIIALLLGINFIANFEGQVEKLYILYILYFLTAFLFYNLYKNKRYDFLNDFEKVLRFFLYHAIFAFFIQFFVKNQLSTYSFEQYKVLMFMNLVFYQIIENPIFLRNQGLLWEPGILQMYMNVLFFISIFVRKNKTFSFLSALIVLSTNSTTGISILIIQLLVLVATSNITLIKKILLIPVFIIFGTGIWILASYNIKNKFDSEGSSVRSSYGRTYDLITGVNIMLEYPLFGIGVNEDKYNALKSKFGYADTELTDEEIYRSAGGGTNSIVKIGFQFGIPIVLLTLLSFYKQQIILVKRELFFIILIISLSSEPIFMSPFILIFVASSMEGLILFFKHKPFSYQQPRRLKTWKHIL